MYQLYAFADFTGNLQTNTKEGITRIKRKVPNEKAQKSQRQKAEELKEAIHEICNDMSSKNCRRAKLPWKSFIYF